MLRRDTGCVPRGILSPQAFGQQNPIQHCGRRHLEGDISVVLSYLSVQQGVGYLVEAQDLRV
jgi:hypothetical protein